MSLRPQPPRYDGKVIHYISNGSGRDSYIWKTNGGLNHTKVDDAIGFEIGTFGSKRHYKPVNNYLPAKHVHYPTDGTGRDIYIKTNEGGLSGNAWSRTNFINGLRGYEKIRYAQADDFLVRSQFVVRPKTAGGSSTKSLNKTTVEQQSNTTMRLSRPKTAKDPYAELRKQPSLPGLRTLYG